MSTCVRSLSGGSGTTLRELCAFGGVESVRVRDGSGMGTRLGRGPRFESGGAEGVTLGALSHSTEAVTAGGRAEGEGGAVTAGGRGEGGGITAGVSIVGVNDWTSVRESGPGGIVWTSVRESGDGVGIDRGSGRLRGDGDGGGDGLCEAMGEDVRDGAGGGEAGRRADGGETIDGGRATGGAPRIEADGVDIDGVLPSRGVTGETDGTPSRAVGTAGIPSRCVFALGMLTLSRDRGCGVIGAFGMTAVVSRVSRRSSGGTGRDMLPGRGVAATAFIDGREIDDEIAGLSQPDCRFCSPGKSVSTSCASRALMSAGELRV